MCSVDNSEARAHILATFWKHRYCRGARQAGQVTGTEAKLVLIRGKHDDEACDINGVDRVSLTEVEERNKGKGEA